MNNKNVGQICADYIDKCGVQGHKLIGKCNTKTPANHPTSTTTTT